MYPNNNMYNGFMQRQAAYPQNGYPQGYGGAYPPQYMAAQQVQQTMQPQEPPITDLRFLTSDEMKAFIVMPNTKVLLIDKDHGVACVKSADMSGQSAAKMYSFVPLSDAPKEEKTEEVVAASAFDKELRDLIERVERLENAKSNRPKNNSENK